MHQPRVALRLLKRRSVSRSSVGNDDSIPRQDGQRPSPFHPPRDGSIWLSLRRPDGEEIVLGGHEVGVRPEFPWPQRGLLALVRKAFSALLLISFFWGQAFAQSPPPAPEKTSLPTQTSTPVSKELLPVRVLFRTRKLLLRLGAGQYGGDFPLRQDRFRWVGNHLRRKNTPVLPPGWPPGCRRLPHLRKKSTSRPRM